MSSQRFAAWVVETKEAVTEASSHPINNWFYLKAVVYALLTIAIAIHEAAETKGK